MNLLPKGIAADEMPGMGIEQVQVAYWIASPTRYPCANRAWPLRYNCHGQWQVYKNIFNTISFAAPPPATHTNTRAPHLLTPPLYKKKSAVLWLHKFKVLILHREQTNRKIEFCSFLKFMKKKILSVCERFCST